MGRDSLLLPTVGPPIKPRAGLWRKQARRGSYRGSLGLFCKQKIGLLDKWQFLESINGHLQISTLTAPAHRLSYLMVGKKRYQLHDFVLLAEVDLPMSKGMNLLKYIMRNKDLRRIPVIMMSARDEVSIVVKCLRLGAADYLVKPLRTNELLNLWTHMWRRRGELGLAERNILNYDFDLVASDPSDANTNSTTLFSDDTADKSRKASNPDMGAPIHLEDELAAATVEFPPNDSTECRPGVPGITGQLACGPKKSELKIGESSAFFTYVKSPAVKSSTQASTPNDESAARIKILEEDLPQSVQQVVNDTQVHENGEAWENCSQGDDFPSSSSVLDSLSLERSSTPASIEFLQQKNYGEDKILRELVPPRNEPRHDPSAQLFENNLLELRNLASSGVLSQYKHLQHCHSHSYVGGMALFPYYPDMCVQHDPMLTGHSWPSVENSSSGEVKPTERRPHLRGQFVRKPNGVTVDLNSEPCADYDEEEDYEQVSRDSSPEDDTQ
ncbi:hypothetical protein F3Y22_tig00111566pilonHSYRG00142 [Hibiscus syriacus]|uniref:Response regulatory domain-containing protein n=1 Tax=Hibiscus syriacus TaxID=106335 RepID=A0A6A2Y6I1_HIBSY|nr:hypothetical protein F3Y22_tig00111566pilonHSYRG00142 [Hibiscus syriacus]